MFEKKRLLATLSWIFAATIVAGVTFAGYRLMQTQQHLAKVVANLSLEGEKAKTDSNELKAELEKTSSEVDQLRKSFGGVQSQLSALAKTSADKGIVDVVHDYLIKNPEILVEMTNELDKRQVAEQADEQLKVISENADKIFRSPLAFVAGNPNGDVTVVEFFDYNCPYCRRALPDVVKLVNTDKNVRLVLKELPIFGDDSEAAAKAALASEKQGKYFEMYQKLFTEPGRANEAKALRIAQELGLDVSQLKKDMQESLHPEITRRGQGSRPEARAARHAALPSRRS